MARSRAWKSRTDGPESNAAGPLRQRQWASLVENRSLAALRDALLPKLMSGELRVRDAEKQVEEVV
jgi:type I restriction enzyme S subunit